MEHFASSLLTADYINTAVPRYFVLTVVLLTVLYYREPTQVRSEKRENDDPKMSNPAAGSAASAGPSSASSLAGGLRHGTNTAAGLKQAGSRSITRGLCDYLKPLSTQLASLHTLLHTTTALH